MAIWNLKELDKLPDKFIYVNGAMTSGVWMQPSTIPCKVYPVAVWNVLDQITRIISLFRIYRCFILYRLCFFYDISCMIQIRWIVWPTWAHDITDWSRAAGCSSCPQLFYSTLYNHVTSYLLDYCSDPHLRVENYNKMRALSSFVRYPKHPDNSMLFYPRGKHEKVRQ